MSDDRYVEYGAATGILFVVLSIVGFRGRDSHPA
jgi:hypothetical protein